MFHANARLNRYGRLLLIERAVGQSWPVAHGANAMGMLVHVDVKKIGKIPDGAGWSAHGRTATTEQRHKGV